MNSNGKKSRKNRGMNRFEIKRATRSKRHESLNNPEYDPNVGTNARISAKRREDRRKV